MPQIEFPQKTADADVSALLRVQSERAQELSRRATRVNTLIEQNRNERTALEKEAVSKYGTSNLGNLRAKLADDRTENARKVTEFVAQLDGYEKIIVEAERMLGAK